MNAEPIDDDPVSGAGRPPSQRPSTRRGSNGTRRTTAEATSTEPTTTAPAPVDLPSTPAQVPVVTPPADPPTTELRGSVARTLEPPVSTPLAEALPIAAPAPANAGPLPTNIYRARRPGVAILLIIPAVAVGVLFVRALAIAAFGDPFHLAGIIASVCALASLPFLVAGVYGLVSGAAHGAEHYGFKVWARPPLAHLLVGLAFVVAAGLAIG